MQRTRTRVQPGRAFLSRYVRQISHTFACNTRDCTARRTAARVREREARSTRNFSIDRRPSGPARLGSTKHGESHVVLACRYRYRALAFGVAERATLRCSRCADKALIAAPRYAAPLGSRKDRAPRIKTDVPPSRRRRCVLPVAMT